MSALIKYSPSQEYAVEDLFSLAIKQRHKSTNISMQLLQSQYTTMHIPNIVGLLQQHLPNVLLTQCFNDDNLPFIVEVKNTELGHLFEHILLEFLCQLKIAKGHQEAVFAGRTSWNWMRYPKGRFQIHLDCGIQDADILPLAIEKTIELMKIIMGSQQATLFPNKRIFVIKNGMKNGKRMKRKSKIKNQKLKIQVKSQKYI